MDAKLWTKQAKTMASVVCETTDIHTASHALAVCEHSALQAATQAAARTAAKARESFNLRFAQG